MNESIVIKKMSSGYLHAYQSSVNNSKKITFTKISKVSYLLKLKAQSNSITDLDRKHKAWAQKLVITY